MNILSWPPRSSTARTKCACSAVVHRILGALELLFRPPAAGLDTAPPTAGHELFLNPWALFGWCSTSSRPRCLFGAASWSPSRTSPSSPTAASGDGGLMCRERSGAIAVVIEQASGRGGGGGELIVASNGIFLCRFQGKGGRGGGIG